MPQPPQLAPLDVEEQQLYYKLLNTIPEGTLAQPPYEETHLVSAISLFQSSPKTSDHR